MDAVERRSLIASDQWKRITETWHAMTATLNERQYEQTSALVSHFVTTDSEVREIEMRLALTDNHLGEVNRLWSRYRLLYETAIREAVIQVRFGVQPKRMKPLQTAAP